MSVALAALRSTPTTTNWFDHAKYLHRELLKYIYEDLLTKNTMPNISRNFVEQNEHGWTALAFDIEGMKRKPANARSMPSLFKKIERYGYQYYRPNLSYTSKSHRKCQLRWLVAFIFDFDEDQLEVLGISNHEQLIAHVESFGYEVCGVVRTSSGYHVYLPMQPLRGIWNGQQTIQRYDRVLKKMAKQIGSDINAASAEHYFRTPQPSNVVYFRYAQKPSFDQYEAILADQGEIFEVSLPTTAADRNESRISFGRLMSQKAMLKLLSGDFAQQTWAEGDSIGKKKIGRNNAAFTLALGMKCDGWTIEEATDELFAWYLYRINRNGFTWEEVKRAIKQAYEKNYKGPSSVYVEAFTGLKFYPVSTRKLKEEKVRVPFKETEDKLIDYLRRYHLEFKKDLVMSQSKLADVLNVKCRSLQYVLKDLKERGLIDIETKREGRSNVSIYFLSLELLEEKEENSEEPGLNLIHEDKGSMIAPAPSKSNRMTAPVRSDSKAMACRIIHDAIPFTYFCAIGSLDFLHSDRLVHMLWGIDGGYS